MSRRIDTDAIKAQIPVADYAERLGVELRRMGAQLRGACPVCDSTSRNPFAVKDDVWHCHSCQGKGDVIDLYRAVHGGEFLDAARGLADAMGVDAEVELDDDARQARQTAREQRARKERIQKQAAELGAPAFWAELDRTSDEGLAYLERRGVRAAAGDVRFDTGAVCLPLRDRDGRIFNVVRRRTGVDKIKVLGLKHCGTLGTFGDLRQLEHTRGPVVIVEGFFDWLTARVMAPELLVLGAHGAGRLPEVVRMVAELCAERGLVFVPHRGDTKQIGEKYAKQAIEVALELGLPRERIRRFDVGGTCGDLNDYLLEAGAAAAKLEEAPTLAELDDEHNFELTDAGNARRFAHIYGRRFRYVPETEQWLRWDGRHWAPAFQATHLARAAYEVTLAIKRQAVMTRSREPKIAEAFHKHAHGSQSKGRLGAMVDLVRSVPGMSVELAELDGYPRLLNFANGTLDFEAGRLRPHRREDLLTGCSPIAYDPDAKCPLWDRFLAEVFEPNPDALEFVRRFAGYSLTGDTSAQCLLFAHGSGANGKGVLFRRIQRILGPKLAIAAPSKVFVEQRIGNTSEYGMAAFCGKRALFVSELNQGDRLAEGLVKDITGGDPISARQPAGRYFMYEPRFKLWMSSNHLPQIRGNDRGIWRRFKLVPFEVSFEGRRDDELDEKLDAELPGILAWAVRGCLDWLADGGGMRGLGESESIASATEAYRSESDAVGRFLEACCVTHVEGAKQLTTTVYAAYRKWAEGEGGRPLSNVQFGREMKGRGFTVKKSNSRRYYPVGLLRVGSDDD